VGECVAIAQDIRYNVHNATQGGEHETPHCVHCAAHPVQASLQAKPFAPTIASQPIAGTWLYRQSRANGIRCASRATEHRTAGTYSPNNLRINVPTCSNAASSKSHMPASAASPILRVFGSTAAKNT